MRALFLTVLVVLGLASCNAPFPGRQIKPLPNSTELATPPELQQSFQGYFKPGEESVFRTYSSQESFATISAFVQAEAERLGYEYDPRLVVRSEDKTGTGAGEIGDFMCVYWKRGSKYVIAVADLEDLRNRGEKISGTGDYMVVVGAPNNIQSPFNPNPPERQGDTRGATF